MCGTPLIGSNYGGFTETIIEGFNGYRANTLGDWLAAIEQVQYLDRAKIAEAARAKYSLETCGKQYDSIFRIIYDLKDAGWYNTRSHRIPNLAPTTDSSKIETQ